MNKIIICPRCNLNWEEYPPVIKNRVKENHFSAFEVWFCPCDEIKYYPYNPPTLVWEINDYLDVKWYPESNKCFFSQRNIGEFFASRYELPYLPYDISFKRLKLFLTFL